MDKVPVNVRLPSGEVVPASTVDGRADGAAPAAGAAGGGAVSQQGSPATVRGVPPPSSSAAAPQPAAAAAPPARTTGRKRVVSSKVQAALRTPGTAASAAGKEHSQGVRGRGGRSAATRHGKSSGGKGTRTGTRKITKGKGKRRYTGRDAYETSDESSDGRGSSEDARPGGRKRRSTHRAADKSTVSKLQLMHGFPAEFSNGFLPRPAMLSFEGDDVLFGVQARRRKFRMHLPATTKWRDADAAVCKQYNDLYGRLMAPHQREAVCASLGHSHACLAHAYRECAYGSLCDAG